MGESVPQPAPKPGRVLVYRALQDYKAKSDKEMSFNEGDLLYVTESNADDEFLPARSGDQSGLIPRRYVKSTEHMAFPLHDAAKRGNIAAVQECLQNDVSINSLDKSGSTALYWACHGGHLELVKLLVDYPNVCISAQNKLGDTALHAAAWKGHLECLIILLDHGADTIIRNSQGKRPIDIASDAQCQATLQLAMRQVHTEPDHEYFSDSSADFVTEL